MATSTPINGWSIPQLADVANIETAITSFASGVDSRVNPIFANNAARDSAIPSPTAGQECFVTTDNIKYVYRNSTWKMLSPYRSVVVTGGTVSSIDFSSIPSTLRSLRVYHTLRGDTAAVAINVRMRINGSSSSVYQSQGMVGSGAGTSAAAENSSTSASFGSATAANQTAGQYAAGIINFYGWNSPHTHFLSWHFLNEGRGSGGAMFVEVGGGSFNATGPYTSLTFFPVSGGFITGSQIVLEGWD